MIPSNLKDSLSAMVLIVFALVLFFYLIPHHVTQAQTAALSPRFFPYFGSLLIGVGGAILLLSSFASNTNEEVVSVVITKSGSCSLQPYIVILVMAIFVMMFEPVGYLLATPPMVVALMLVFGARGVLLLCTVPWAVTAALFLMFSTGFGVSLP